jgi:hypothetical protein
MAASIAVMPGRPTRTSNSRPSGSTKTIRGILGLHQKGQDAQGVSITGAAGLQGHRAFAQENGWPKCNIKVYSIPLNNRLYRAATQLAFLSLMAINDLPVDPARSHRNICGNVVLLPVSAKWRKILCA